MFKVNNGNIGTMFEVFAQLTIKTLDIFNNLLYCFYPSFEQLNTSRILRRSLTNKPNSFCYLLKSYIYVNSESVKYLRCEILRKYLAA